MKNEIKSEKILVGKIFSEMWFRIPEYQRPYVWGDDQISDLLEDTSYAMLEKPDSEYFLGSFVFQSKPKNTDGIHFSENDLLDGQQRITTLLLLFAVLRDLAKDPKASVSCQKCIFQEADQYDAIPERPRITFDIRTEAQEFIEQLAKTSGFTTNIKALSDYETGASDLSVRNMAHAVKNIKSFFADRSHISPEQFIKFLRQNVLLIYVSTEHLEDAFRLFTILNDRGIPLRNSDILKSINLGALVSDQDKKKYATLWENAESELGEDFDRFLNHVRTILVKEKARLSLLQEYEDKIYDPKEREKATGNKKPPLLKKGKETFDFIKRYLEHYKKIVSGSNYDVTDDFRFDNLVRLMFHGLPSTDWVPPLLKYYDRFNESELYHFLKLLDNKFSNDWIIQLTPTARIDAMNDVIKAIEAAENYQDVLESPSLKIDATKLLRELDGEIYGRRFARYVLLKMDYIFQNHGHRMNFETLSVEHILPQNPSDDSQWKNDFTDQHRTEWTNKIGNLVLITRKKNTSQGRLDFVEKKKKYFEKNIDTCPNSLRVLHKYDDWTPEVLKENHDFSLTNLKAYYDA
jgi:uncharacterized protein with ParB-like and HNH nuclease domain